MDLYELFPCEGVLHAGVEVLVAVVVPDPPLRVAENQVQHFGSFWNVDAAPPPLAVLRQPQFLPLQPILCQLGSLLMKFQTILKHEDDTDNQQYDFGKWTVIY